jgi:hypothetical protein
MPLNNTATLELRDYAFSPVNLAKTFACSTKEKVQMSNLRIKIDLKRDTMG